jgi:hypothetical protein
MDLKDSLSFLQTIMKVPPFDLVGRMFDWAGELSYKWGMKLRAYKEKQSRPVQVLITILAILFIIFLLWIMPDEECVLC